jgi:peptidyl-prolyl cis-trans isomerase A (cyclophilin A)
MKTLSAGSLALLTLALTAHPGEVRAQTPDAVRVLIVTELGDIVAELYAEQAPVTANNFLRYVDSGSLDGGSFFRTVREDNQPDDSVRIGVIQGGPPRGAEGFPPIPLERTSVTGLGHLDGTLSMARSGPDTARGQFFISIGDQPELDFGGARNQDGQGFAAFGLVVEGMDIVRRIQAGRADGQRLDPTVEILRVERATEGGR